MFYFSKSKYTSFLSCPKKCWLDKYKSDVRKEDGEALSRMQKGHEIGDLAKGLFGPYEDMTTLKEDGSLDLNAMAKKTQDAIARGVNNICEAAFMFGGLYCAVDILRKTSTGYAVYEVKSAKYLKEYYYVDTAYQVYVVSNCGVNVTGAYIVMLNCEYVRRGELDIAKLFKVIGDAHTMSRIKEEYLRVADNLAEAEKIMLGDEPDIKIGKECVGCAYWEYCTSELPKPNVFDLYNFRSRWKCYDKGILSFPQIMESGIDLTDVQMRQIDYALRERGTHVDKDGVRGFLNKLTYPLYFLDFETMQQQVPEFDGTRPYQTFPFQYSVHCVESESDEAVHKEFLAEAGTYPNRALAERLCKDIPMGVCTLAYSESVERGIIEKLAAEFPDLAEHLLSIASGIVDLLPVFREGYYYKREMGGSFSVKSVLPAVCPDMDYHNLDGVSNGTEAMDIYPKIKYMTPQDAQMAREQLLRYCERDTLAMVKLWQELIRVSK